MIAVSLGKNNGFRDKPHSVLWMFVIFFRKSKKTKYLEIEKTCRSVSHIITRYKFIGFFGSWLGGGLSLSPSIVKVRVAGWWSLSVSFYR